MDDLASVRFEVLRSLLNPPRCVPMTTAGSQHLPFLQWLLFVLRPNTLVTLGLADGGATYCALCETVREHALTTQCLGIAGWGDGSVDDAAFRIVKVHHDRHYGDFSRLVRESSSDELFDVQTVDLLQIDAQSHAAARSGFETWTPRFAQNTVVVMHNILSAEPDGTGNRLWSDLSRRYPAFALSDSGGLGVLAVGTEPAPVVGWLGSLEDSALAAVEETFISVARAVRADSHLQSLTCSAEALKTRLAVQNEMLKRLNRAVSRGAAETAAAFTTVAEQVEAATTEAAAAEKRKDYWEAEAGRRETAFAGERAERDTEMARSNAKIAEMERVIASIYASRSWRITAPVRAISKGLQYGRWRRTVRDALAWLPGGNWAVARINAHRRPPSQQTKETPSPEGLEATKAALREHMAEAFAKFLSEDGKIQLPTPEPPRVSVLLVLFNQAELTYACLQSLTTEEGAAIEVVIVDNASSDQTNALLARVSGARIIRNVRNAGFLHAVNQGVAVSRGEYVLLLNNDAVLRSGSLSALVRTIESAPNVGAVGGRLILPDGTLQEAGSIIWRDGSCLGYCRGIDPEAGEAMFRREVDYCSGALLLFRRALFDELGGFDERFAPAYYEETDFCLRIRLSGRRVIYEPDAVVDHFEFGSSAKSERAIIQQRNNQALFQTKHAASLAEYWEPDPANMVHARMRNRHRGRILVIDDRVPVLAFGAGFPRARSMVWALHDADRFVTFYPNQEPWTDWAEVYSALPREVEVMIGRGPDGLAEFLGERAGYYDCMVVSRPHNMEQVERLITRQPQLFSGTRLVYDAEAVFSLRDIQRAKVHGAPVPGTRARQLVAAELAVAAPADRVITVSEREAAVFREHGMTDVRVIGHGLTVRPTPRRFEERKNLLFVGLLAFDDTPNTDSLLWFTREVLPRLRDRLSEPVRLLAAGRTGSVEIEPLRADPVIHLLGRVDDLWPLYDQARVFVAPTRYAGGIPHKVHEAAAHGVPSVTTGLLADQLGWQDGDALLAANDADGFVERVARIYGDAALWQSVRDAALARVANDCDPEVFARRVVDVVSF